ncbi:hypothetical protein D7B24_007177 [Verticillium nonalfalfae]|uniref:N-acetyltransferase domain-containing protein n=1 Tax=Verticillium nonalfalfae TaxID=1051616 RepID=A0A3M9YAA6_9PEZI|nr:uncharacterized protein D7B24_007177 [Verticillium nonalfalfae]RNJ56458.1 hypothetical protein D7B24_007177 [Verticillium nonalfalfae]
METPLSKSSLATLVAEPRPSLVPPRWADTVRAVTVAESKQAGLSLAHSFASDASSRYLLDVDDMAARSAEHKWKLHVDMMTYTTTAHALDGLVTTIGPDHDAVALWVPPGKDTDGWLNLFRSGLWRLAYRLTPEARRRYNDDFLPLLHDAKAEVMGARDAECYYLVYIGTKPNARKRGYAGKLLDDMIARADAEGRPMYLESSSPDNNAYYAKFGFEFKKDIYLQGSGAPVPLSIMVREPQLVKQKPVYAAVKVQMNRLR